MKKKAFVIPGSTGGHIIPILSVVKNMESRFFLDVHFICSPEGMERKIIPSSYSLHFVSLGRLNRVSLKEKILTLFRLPHAFLKSLYLLIRHRPQFVLGGGGSLSGPVILSAKLLGIKTFLWEPNRVPGLTNRCLFPFVDHIFSAFEAEDLEIKGVEKEKITRVGFLVKKELQEKKPTPPSDFFHVLVLGGSQGSVAISEEIRKIIESKKIPGTKWLVQCGEKNYETLKQAYEPLKNVKLRGFIEEMHRAYSWAHLVISRSGMGAISEIMATGKPSILIPFPFSADDHQRKNAEFFYKKGACLMLDQKQMTENRLLEMISYLRYDLEKRKEVSSKASELFVQDADKVMAEKMVSLVKE